MGEWKEGIREGVPVFPPMSASASTPWTQTHTHTPFTTLTDSHIISYLLTYSTSSSSQVVKQTDSKHNRTTTVRQSRQPERSADHHTKGQKIREGAILALFSKVNFSLYLT